MVRKGPTFFTFMSPLRHEVGRWSWAACRILSRRSWWVRAEVVLVPVMSLFPDVVRSMVSSFKLWSQTYTNFIKIEVVRAPGMSLFVDQGTKAEVGTKAEAGRGDIRHAADERRHEVGR